MLLVINLTGLLNFGHRLNTQGLLVADKPHNYSRPLVGTWSSTAAGLVALTSIVTCAESMMLIQEEYIIEQLQEQQLESDILEVNTIFKASILTHFVII